VAQARILIATDGSPAAVAAVGAGLEIAAATGRSVTFVHANALATELFAENVEEGPSQERIAERDPVLGQAAERARQAGVEARVELIDLEGGTGDLAAEIAGVAEGLGASMIVVGSRGRGTAAGAVLGSVSHGLIKYASVPVLVVHAP
jgi:nucleotide-binding universal stress UspA family protein